MEMQDLSIIQEKDSGDNSKTRKSQDTMTAYRSRNRRKNDFIKKSISDYEAQDNLIKEMRRRKATLDSSADFSEIPKDLDFTKMNFVDLSGKKSKKNMFKKGINDPV